MKVLEYNYYIITHKPRDPIGDLCHKALRPEKVPYRCVVDGLASD